MIKIADAFANGKAFIPFLTCGDPDLETTEQLIPAMAAAGADLLICEATYAENEQAEMAAERGHMTFAQAAGIAARAGVRALWLAHYSQMIEDPLAYLPVAQAVFSGTVCGQDGMRTTLRFDSP